MPNFKDILKKELAEQNILGKELAKICDVTEGSVSKWLKGESVPRQNKLEIIADYLHVSTDYLLGRTIEENTYSIPTFINNVDEAKAFLKSLNLYEFSELNLKNKSDKEIFQLATSLFAILSLSCK
jgi:transcriptional regulator with XRE-family HTH domain